MKLGKRPVNVECPCVTAPCSSGASANCGSAANQTFSFDPFGNINKSGSPNTFQPTYNSATNRFSSVPGCSTLSYDNNGNVTNDCNHTYSWDADGNSVSVDSVALTFDAFDRMVEQNFSGSYYQIVYSPSGAKLAQMNGQSLNRAWVPLPGQATAVYSSTGLLKYRHSDWLGSTRLTSSPTQTYLSSVAYAPFGETYAAAGTNVVSFTGVNSDTVSADYDFLFREYSNEGRWASPDPAGLAAVDPSNPQSWNRYSYVLNAPMNLTDPSGLCGTNVRAPRACPDGDGNPCSYASGIDCGGGGGSCGLDCAAGNAFIGELNGGYGGICPPEYQVCTSGNSDGYIGITGTSIYNCTSNSNSCTQLFGAPGVVYQSKPGGQGCITLSDEPENPPDPTCGLEVSTDLLDTLVKKNLWPTPKGPNLSRPNTADIFAGVVKRVAPPVPYSLIQGVPTLNNVYPFGRVDTWLGYPFLHTFLSPSSGRHPVLDF